MLPEEGLGQLLMKSSQLTDDTTEMCTQLRQVDINGCSSKLRVHAPSRAPQKTNLETTILISKSKQSNTDLPTPPSIAAITSDSKTSATAQMPTSPTCQPQPIAVPPVSMLSNQCEIPSKNVSKLRPAANSIQNYFSIKGSSKTAATPDTSSKPLPKPVVQSAVSPNRDSNPSNVADNHDLKRIADKNKPQFEQPFVSKDSNHNDVSSPKETNSD